MTKQQQFELATGIILSYRIEGGDDSHLPQIFNLIAALCTDAYDRLQVLVTAIGDQKFEQYGAADAGKILRDFEITGNHSDDVARFLDLMHEADEAALLEAKRESAPYGDSFHMAQVRSFLSKYGFNATRSDLEQFLAEQ